MLNILTRKSLVFNLSIYLIYLKEIDEEFLLEKCPDKTAKLRIKLKFQLIGESDEKEIMK